MVEWKTYILSEVASFRTGKLDSNAAKSGGKYPFFTCSPDTLRIDDYAFNQRAILLAGNNAEGNFSVKYYEGKFNAYQRTYVISVDERIANIKFVYYALRLCLKKFKQMSQGTSTKFLTMSILNSFKIDLPPIETQNKIVDILLGLDDKIELNNRINHNLEEQAQALYKSWFVDFEPFNGEMPNTWKSGLLSDILRLKHNFIKADSVGNKPYLPIDIIPMHKLSVDCFAPSDLAQSSLQTFQEDDIVIGAMRVYFHRVVIAPCSGVTRNTCFVLEPYDKDALSYCLCVCNDDSTIDYAQNTSKGSTMPYAVWDNGLGNMDVAIPDNESLSKFHSIIYPILTVLKNSYREQSRLARLRDSILPELMSGQLNINEIDC